MPDRVPLIHLHGPRDLRGVPMLLIPVLIALLALPSPASGARGGIWPPAGVVDADGNGVEDLLDEWLAGRLSWERLRLEASPVEALSKSGGEGWPAEVPLEANEPGEGWLGGNLRLLCLEADDALLGPARRSALDAGGHCRLLQETPRFGGVVVYEVDPAGLAIFLAERDGGRILLDRDGVPALDTSRTQIGTEILWNGPWKVDGDWGATVAILDSGCDTTHDDLGDFSQDNSDGPPPYVGSALDWFPAEQGWPIFETYRVVGWQDVSTDFPEAQGPWDYHYHGTALAGIVAGSGSVDPAYRGVAPRARLTIVKYYEFDGTWHQWAGDFLAACAWTLDNAELYRIGVALAAVNWPVDAGISDAVAELDAAGILCVVAMGNDALEGEPTGYPALSPAALSVGAVNDAGIVAATSSHGPFGGSKPDLVAPGGGLLSASGRITTTDNEPDDTYSGRAGTSLAAAHAAGGAFLLLEAWRQAGIDLPAASNRARLLKAALRATAAPVPGVETPDGEGVLALVNGAARDSVAGNGLLQLPAALDALLSPLGMDGSVTDSLAVGGREVFARRLDLLRDSACRVEVEPEEGLDVSLSIVPLRVLMEEGWSVEVLTADHAGPGGAEELRALSRIGDVTVAVVRRLSGEGDLTLRIRPVDETLPGDYAWDLGGAPKGWLNTGRFAGSLDEETVVAVSGVEIDPNARRIHALDTLGRPRPGWPVSFFVTSGGTKSLTAPLVWDLDGTPGDEVVVASNFGKLFRLSGSGGLAEWDLADAQGQVLTAPVGLLDAGGRARVAVVSSAGRLYRLDTTGTLLGATDLGGTGPAAPAVGRIESAAGEELVVALGSGLVTVVDAAGTVPTGWPVALAAGTVRAPVLVDWDGDGLHEIVVPSLSMDGSQLAFRILGAGGAPDTGDGAVAVPPGGGRWLALSDPGFLTGPEGVDPRIVISGLADNGAGGEERRWFLASVVLAAGGVVSVEPLEGFGVRATVAASTLNLEWTGLPAPLSHDFRSGADCESEFLVGLGWEENISGRTNLTGTQLSWFRSSLRGDVVSGSSPVIPAGRIQLEGGTVSGAVLRLGDGLWSRLSAQGRTLRARVGNGPTAATVCWGVQRGDGRNSGAAPEARPEVSAAQTPPIAGARLRLWPNPSSQRVWAAWDGALGAEARLDIYDLRGRRVRSYDAGRLGPDRQLAWDGRDGRGRSVAAGTYLFVLRQDRRSETRRVVITR
jgi:hypothetical protein